MPRFPIEPYSKPLSRRLRRSMTDEELRLWWFLRNQTPVKWRRQEPIGRFIVDFVCYERRLIVEVDGHQHADSAYDRRRDAWLVDRGFEVVRFSNGEVNHEIDAVVDSIALTLDARGPS
jgi:very-short-patch-repair endonuclease